MAIFYHFAVLLFSLAEVRLIHAAKFRSLSLGQRYPDAAEIATCGNIRDIIRRNSARFRKILVRNTNNEIDFANDDCRRMTARAKSKIDVLASRVRGRWSNVRLRVILGWTDQTPVDTQKLLHYEGRALRLQTSDRDSSKLRTLAGLAVEAGFDWVYYASSSYIHASVIRDVCQTSVDLAFILDSSGSVGSYNFNLVKNFVKNVVDFFNIGKAGTHVAVVTYSTNTKLEFNLKAYYTKSSIKTAVGKISYRGGWTYTANSLDYVRKNIFATSQGMRPDQSIPKVTVLLTDGYSNGRSVADPAKQLRDKGVNIFSVGVGRYVNPKELNTIATDPDSTHVFRLNSFSDLAGWVDKLSAVSCDEGATVSSCDDTITTVESDTFKYFRTQFNTVTNNKITVEVRDIQGISHLFTSLKSSNPGPMDINSAKNESNTSPRYLTFPISRNQLVYVAVQGQQATNKFKLSMWDALFTQDTFMTSVTEEQPAHVTVLRQTLTSSNSYRLRYSIVEGNVPNSFIIEPNSGVITTARKLDREKRASYRLTVLAQNVRNSCHKGRAIVNVKVSDINDNSPTFAHAQYSGTILEGTRANTLVAKVTATDIDSGINAQLTYSITFGNQGNKFSINNKGEVRTNQELDYEVKRSYTLEIKVQDGGGRDDNTTLTIIVQDVNEPPYFVSPCANSGSCRFSIKENNARNAQIGVIQARDPESCSSLIYKITTEPSQGSRVFAVSNSGDITVLSSLDREFKSHYTAVVTVEDCGKPALKVSTRIRVEVLDENDMSPRFTQTVYRASVRENIDRNSKVLQVSASDADAGNNSQLSYSLVSGDKSAFSIDSKTGIILSSLLFDRESKDSYSLTVRATDHGISPLSESATVVVTILDVNDNKPDINNLPQKISVSEGKPPGSVVFVLKANDKDQGVNSDLRGYIDSGNDDGSFRLNAQDGSLRVTRKLDFETKKNYTLNIRVTDRGSPPLSSFGTLEIALLDENDNAPVFSLSSYRATVKENTAKGTTFFQVTATDLDSGSNGNITYAIVNGNEGDTFSIDSSGSLLIKNSPDFETRNQYNLMVDAVDSGVPRKAAYAHVTVIIEDVNDHAPQFNQSEYRFTVSEGAVINENVGSIFATDLDSGFRGRLYYSIKGGDGSGVFTIGGDSGTLYVSSKLDRERKDRYILNVEARDGGKTPKTALVDVKITISDINDNKPLFDKSPYLVHVTEDAALGSSVVTLFAKDDDIGENSKVAYAIQSGNEQGAFNLNDTSGLMKLKKYLDRETKDSYKLVVTASDHGTPPLTSSVDVTVVVNDVNDNPPTFPKSQYNCTVAENLVRGVAVCYVTATDPDTGVNGQLYYSIVTGNVNNAFQINSATGEITTTKTLDRETTSVYNLRVMAEDCKSVARSGKTRSFNATTSVLVLILDENDNSPLFNSTYTFTVREDAASRHEVGRVFAKDKDAGKNGDLTYCILAGNSGDSFNINPISGAITVKSQLDRETYAQYSLTIQAKDSGVPSLSSRTVVTVIIDDFNDNAPVFSKRVFYGRIREDASTGSKVLKVEASDADEGTNGQIQFRLQGEGRGNFSIDSSGFIHTATPLDYEITSSYFLNVTAKDGGSPPASASALVNITVVNVNDNVPVFDTSLQASMVREDAAVGTRVVRLNATDADGNQLNFSILSGNTDGAFAMHLTSGIISVAAKLDREKIENYTLSVEARDAGGYAVTHNATIQVIDVNDNVPMFQHAAYSKNISENLPAGHLVAKVVATDKDTGNNALISYKITSGDTSKFTIHPFTGCLTTSASLDREQGDYYRLILTAKDHGTPSLSSSVIVTVNVLDENDNTPRFSLPLYTASVLENTAVKTKLLHVAATDPDAHENGTVTFSIISGNVNDVFEINNASGFLAVNKNLDREERDAYSLFIKATDNAVSNPRSVFVHVNFTVLDENDNSPEFVNVANLSVVENAKRGRTVGSVSATDSDIGINGEVKFSFVEGNDNSAFYIDSSSGEITVNGRIDREIQASYRLTVRAKDMGKPPMNTKKVFFVAVQDENDNPPRFETNFYQGSIRENLNANPVIQVKAIDDDTEINAQITYSITGGNFKSYFSIDSQTGWINSTTSIDFEQEQRFNLTVSASDSKYTSYARVAIEVLNENDNNPKFKQSRFYVSVAENSPVLTSVTTILASDVDSFGQLSYSIESVQPANQSDTFSVDLTSGVITTADDLDRELIDRYVLQVKVVDSGEPQLSDFAMVIVDITDMNDNPPEFSVSTMQAILPEDAGVGSLVAKIFATDADFGINANISYSINSSTDMSAFVISTETGSIATNKKLDRENISSYVLICQARDHGQPQLGSMPIMIHVSLTDVNDNAPVFQQSAYAVNISEDASTGSVVEEVLAVDPDVGLNGKVVYGISGGNEDGAFIIGNRTGVLSLSKELDRESRDSYTLTVVARDLGSPQMASSVQVVIKVLDVNDNRPQFNDSSLQGGILENLPVGTFVMRVIATDADIGSNAQLLFNFTTKAYSDVFALNSNNGEITALKSLDRETQDQYSMKIIVSDKGDPQLTSSAVVIINVIDVDDNCPQFVPAEYNVTISENLEFNQSIVQVTATDSDLKNNEVMSYAIRSGNTGGAFTIDEQGNVRVSSAGVDREVADSLRIVIRAGPEDCGVNTTIGDGNQNEGNQEDKLASVAFVNVIVTDVNDNPPRFLNSPYKFELNSQDATEIGRIAAKDDDLGSGGVVKFRLLKQTEVQGKRKVTVQAFDMGKPSLNSSIDVTIETSITCEAMVFRVTQNGTLKADTLCEFTKKPSSVTRLVGDKHKLSCSAKGNTKPEYRWMKDGRFVSNWDEKGDYVIEQITEDDQGGYSCLASSSAGLIQSSVAYMTVNDPPKIAVHPDNSSVQLGGRITLRCNASGDPVPSFAWFKDGIAMVEAAGIKPFNPVLVLEDAIKEDEARYYCVASNIAGKTQSNSANLKVFGKEALVSMTLSVENPNKDGTCQIFDVQKFEELLSKALKLKVHVTSFKAPERCEEHPCDLDPCKHNGFCSRQGSQYDCLCKPGWSGDHCEVDVDECNGDPCFYSGTCFNTDGSFKCTCTSGKTGKTCELEKAACNGNPCNRTDICVLSDRSSSGFQCANRELETTLILSEVRVYSSAYDLETEIENLIRTAPNNLEKNVTTRRKRTVPAKLDYGACSVRVTRYNKREARFVLICPREMTPLEPKVSQRFVCGLMFDAGLSTSCGGSEAMMTPRPVTAKPPIKPLVVKLAFFAEDSESGSDLNANKVIDMISSGKAKELEENGFKVQSVSSSNTAPQTAEAESSTGLIAGLTVGILCLILCVAAIATLYVKRRRKPVFFHYTIQQRSAMGRKESQRNILDREMSVKDICRSEKHYLNVAFDSESPDLSDDEGDFMVQVNLGDGPQKKKSPSTMSNIPYYYNTITELEAEGMLSSTVKPGTFIVRRGDCSREFVLTAKAPEGGPSFRHLPFQYDKTRKEYVVQFGSMTESVNFSSVNELVSHFQVTPIEFEEDSPDLVLSLPWNKTEI
ncbi:protocadherin Fat 4-like isoform X2 [Acropora muricata]|uniref:protocadherin Fat 4-like isoform X2 n=1 Tax=Acropora muricata TaxID=159855 RepID=UPI0034E3F2F2